MKNLLLLLLTVLVLWGCKKDGSSTQTLAITGSSAIETSTPPETATFNIIGTWKEDFVIDKSYKNDLLIKIDTMPKLNLRVTSYTEFTGDGRFQSYRLNGLLKTGIATGTYAYNASGSLFTQTWASDTSTNNPANWRANYNYPNYNSNPGSQFKVTSISDNSIVLELKIPDNVYGAYDGPPVTSTGYTMLIRKLALVKR
ncbi:hypothetical protein ABZR88_05920 [Mucilaginibacter yixingensis]|nr:hypothetical protein [Mucilaginibacter yixingensis]